MSGTIRLFELAKAIGVSAKVLMADLKKAGIEVKTHMAVFDEKMHGVLAKKYPDLDTKVKAHAEQASSEETEAKVKKPRAPKASSSKVVTSRTAVAKKAAKGKKAASDAEIAAAASAAKGVPAMFEPQDIELLQRPEGQAGTVTLEQRVVKEGVLRRRRVETPIPQAQPPAPPPVEEVPPQEEIEIEAENVEVEAEAPAAEAPPPKKLSESKPILRRVAEALMPRSQAKSRFKTEPAKVEAEKQAPAPQQPPSPPAPAGRNLSAPSRLKIVADQPLVPPSQLKVGQRPQPGTTGAQTDARRPAHAAAPGIAPAPVEEGDEAGRASAAAAKKKTPARPGFEQPNKVTKRDLIGMMEEVEIQRPLGRRPKKAQARIERKQTQITTPGATKRKIRIDHDITIADLADRMGVKASDVIRKLLQMGQMATLHQRIDFDTATLVSSEYNYEIENVAQTAQSVLQAHMDVKDDEGAKESRAPIVTVMGHVDHGKTSLLDSLRKTRVAQGEAGGITQHIGAYQVVVNGKKLTFIDTPGHAAFTAMRARGASVTDIVILVVAADEGVKPQTLEALAHAQAAKVPIVVAINKIDKPEANPDRVIQELSKHNLVPEEWGGDTIYCRVSAITGQGLPELLENVLVQAEILDLRANPARLAQGVVIESRLDKGKGPVATVIVQTGTLKVGCSLVSGSAVGRVRAIYDDAGKSIKEAGPSSPAEVLGFDSVPSAGETFSEVTEDAVARQVSELAQLAKKKADSLKNSRLSLEDMYKKMQAGDVSELRVVLKGDVQGSLEAIADSLLNIKHEKVRVNVLYKAVGGISESDVDLAAASGAIVFGFNVRPTSQAKEAAEREKVQIKSYEIIYELIDEVKLAMQGLLAPIIKENVLGSAEVREVFSVSKVGSIAGCFVKSGKIQRNAMGRLVRDSVVVYTAKIASLRRFKDDAKEVAEGFECGIRLENFTDVKVGDLIECFENVEMKQAV